MRLGITIFPPKEIQDIANSYRKRYDPRYSLVPPHITLKEPFEIEGEQLATISDELQKISSEFQPFTLNIHKVSTFHPTNNVVYLAIQQHETLTKLHESLYTPEILKHERKYNYVPHITIGQEMSDDELHDVYGRLKMAAFDHSFTVTRFHLVYQLENHMWTTNETFTLKG